MVPDKTLSFVNVQLQSKQITHYWTFHCIEPFYIISQFPVIYLTQRHDKKLASLKFLMLSSIFISAKLHRASDAS